jgi:hypothetical protein
MMAKATCLVGLDVHARPSGCSRRRGDAEASRLARRVGRQTKDRMAGRFALKRRKR